MEVEDEFHFLMKCSAYTGGIAVLLQSSERICPQFMHLSDNLKFIYVLIVTGDITKTENKGLGRVMCL